MSKSTFIEPLFDGYQLQWVMLEGYRVLDSKSRPVTEFWNNDREVAAIIIGLIKSSGQAAIASS